MHLHCWQQNAQEERKRQTQKQKEKQKKKRQTNLWKSGNDVNEGNLRRSLKQWTLLLGLRSFPRRPAEKNSNQKLLIKRYLIETLVRRCHMRRVWCKRNLIISFDTCVTEMMSQQIFIWKDTLLNFFIINKSINFIVY